jgi:3-dehydroquinate dehydratase-2
MKNILVLNGPNLNLLGKREPHIYGSQTFEDYFEQIKFSYPNVVLHYFQSNHEGQLIDKLHEIGFLYDGIVFNPGGYTHTSVALADAVSAIKALLSRCIYLIPLHARHLGIIRTFRGWRAALLLGLVWRVII